jgi:hypothetical protein
MRFLAITQDNNFSVSEEEYLTSLINAGMDNNNLHT